MAKWEENANTKLDAFINDITTLEVVTMSGKLTLTDLTLQEVDGSNGKKRKRIDFGDLLDNMKGDLTKSSKIDVVAFTKIEVDKDVQQFVKADMTDEDLRLFQLHLETVQLAQDARRATFGMLLSIVKGPGHGGHGRLD